MLGDLKTIQTCVDRVHESKKRFYRQFERVLSQEYNLHKEAQDVQEVQESMDVNNTPVTNTIPHGQGEDANNHESSSVASQEVLTVTSPDPSSADNVILPNPRVVPVGLTLSEIDYLDMFAYNTDKAKTAAKEYERNAKQFKQEGNDFLAKKEALKAVYLWKNVINSQVAIGQANYFLKNVFSGVEMCEPLFDSWKRLEVFAAQHNAHPN